MLSQIAEEIAKIPDIEARQNTAAYTEILAGLRFKKNLIRQVLSEEIMQESVIYQDIVQKEAFIYTVRFLNRRFSDINLALTERLQVLSAQKLEDLGEALLDFSNITDLEAWLNQQESD